MLEKFYTTILPQQGVYCVATINAETKAVKHQYGESLEELFTIINKVKKQSETTHDNIYVTPATFEGFRRKADECLFIKTFFIDVDTHGSGSYSTKEEAFKAIDYLLEKTGLPDPIIVDSGGGVHAYWVMDIDISYEEWKPYAEKFKELCAKHIKIDLSVTSDAARLMRCPTTFNYRYEIPFQAKVISNEFFTYEFEEFKDFLGEIPVEQSSVKEVIASLPKGLDDDTKKMLKLDNFKQVFEELADKSINGNGCEQVRYVLENEKTVGRELWAAVLTIAVRCEDGDEAIHKMSSEYPGYSYEQTEKDARSFGGPRTCEWFTNPEDNDHADLCSNCKYRGRISGPIELSRVFQTAPPRDLSEETSTEEGSVRETPGVEEVFEMPSALAPFVRGAYGGIYYVPPSKKDKQGVVHDSEPILISSYDLFPVRRMYSTHDGECMTMRLLLPNDEPREFLMPLKAAYAQDKLKDISASNGVLCHPSALPYLMNYIIKWGQYMVSIVKADVMRMQMGWTNAESSEVLQGGFVAGESEYHATGPTPCAASPYLQGMAKLMRPMGTYEKWKEAANKLNLESLETHAFCLLAGFGSPLMQFMSTSGVVISLHGNTGVAKTGALYAGLSLFASPKEISVYEATDNALVMRFVNHKNILFGVDEVGNKEPKVLSHLAHSISQGKAKIRMQSSVNAEREHLMNAALIAIFTTNVSLYSKFEQDKASPDGEAARVVEFNLSKPKVLEGEGGSALGRSIFETLRHNYGFAGPMYLEELFKLGIDHILERIEHWRARFISVFGDDGSYRFYENLVAATFAGGEIAVNAGIVTIDLERVFNHVLKEMIMIRDKVIKLNKLDYETLLGDFLNENLGSLLVIKDEKVVMEPRYSIVGRLCPDEDSTIVSKSVLDKWLNKKNVSSREFELNMKERELLVDVKVGRLVKGWKHAPSNNPSNNYYFKSKLDPDLFNSEDDTSANTGT